VGVVDDDDAVRESLRFLLEFSGYRVAGYASAAKFLQDAPQGELTCLVVDQQMPGLTGLQMVAHLRAQGFSLPTALITGSVSVAMACRAEELGLSLVLEKPLDDDRLLEFVAESAG
jgi:FixJ family two-component response regulator